MPLEFLLVHPEFGEFICPQRVVQIQIEFEPLGGQKIPGVDGEEGSADGAGAAADGAFLDRDVF